MLILLLLDQTLRNTNLRSKGPWLPCLLSKHPKGIPSSVFYLESSKGWGRSGFLPLGPPKEASLKIINLAPWPQPIPEFMFLILTLPGKIPYMGTIKASNIPWSSPHNSSNSRQIYIHNFCDITLSDASTLAGKFVENFERNKKTLLCVPSGSPIRVSSPFIIFELFYNSRKCRKLITMQMSPVHRNAN